MYIDLSDKKPSHIYHVMTQTVIPRPIAWVLTDSAFDKSKTNYNLAPFSYFSAVSSQPPLLMLSVGKKPNGEDKDTCKNVQNGSKLVIHIASDDQYVDVTNSAATLEHGVSEIDQAGLELESFNGFELPRLKSCDIAFACELYETKEIGETPQQLIFCKVLSIYVSDKVLKEDQKGRMIIDASEVSPLARLGASQYSKFGKIISQSRPK